MEIKLQKNIKTLIAPSFRLLKPKRKEIADFKNKTKAYFNSIDSSESEVLSSSCVDLLFILMVQFPKGLILCKALMPTTSGLRIASR